MRARSGSNPRALAAAALAASLFAMPALAETDQLGAAWDAAGLAYEGVLTNAEAAKLNVVAYHAAVAGLCEGFTLDARQVADVTGAILDAGPADATQEALLNRQVDIMLTLGTAKGLFLAEGALHRERFCAQAKETRDEPDFDDLWTD